jgi:long-subunit fatty acid transport protein
VLGNPIDDVANDYFLPGFGLKMDLNDKVSAALVYDRPFGADIAYDPANPILGGTTATATTNTFTALLKYQFNERVSAFGGLRYQTAEGDISLDGAAYGGPPLGGVSGYEVSLDRDAAAGYVLGVAYEVPEIALRVALTYNSEITHEMDTLESLGGAPLAPPSVTEVKTPQSVNLDFQTGIAQDTLLFGSIRWVEHSTFRVDPAGFVGATGGGLIDLEDTTTYRLGLGRRFNEKWTGSVTLAYEAPGDELVSPLAPSTGFSQIALGAAYQATETMEIAGGVSYTVVGDARPETGTPDVARADFSDNDAFGLGLRVSFNF